jgi:hypothetical protein
MCEIEVELQADAVLCSLSFLGKARAIPNNLFYKITVGYIKFKYSFGQKAASK